MLAPSPTPRPRSIDDLIAPDLAARLDRLDVLSRKVFAGRLPGERRSKRRGRSVEFDDYRDYVPGDDPRHIDWNVLARLDRLLIKLFREDEDLALHLVVDASASMDAGDPSKLALAQRLALALGMVGLVNQNRVCATVVGAVGAPEVVSLAPVRGRRNLARLARFVLDAGLPTEHRESAAFAVRAEGPPDLARAIRHVARTRAGKGVMIVLSDFLGPIDLAPALSALAAGVRGGGFDTTLVQILSPGELDPAKERDRGLWGDLRLTDVETGRSAEITLDDDQIRGYKRRLDAHTDRLARACSARGFGFARIGSDADAGDFILGILRRRGVVG